mgnify:FL=1
MVRCYGRRMNQPETTCAIEGCERQATRVLVRHFAKNGILGASMGTRVCDNHHAQPLHMTDVDTGKALALPRVVPW